MPMDRASTGHFYFYVLSVSFPRKRESSIYPMRLLINIRFLIVTLLSTCLLTACGFQLRGQQTLPFRSLYIAISPSSQLGAELKRNITAGTETRLVDTPEEAQAILSISNELREKTILSLNSSGKVREFRLRYRVDFRVHDTRGINYIPQNEIVIQRDFSFNDTQVLAKENEEALLYRDMQNDMVQQILRRLAAAKTASEVVP